jgi:hypothetical protein
MGKGRRKEWMPLPLSVCLRENIFSKKKNTIRFSFSNNFFAAIPERKSSLLRGSRKNNDFRGISGNGVYR